MMLDPSIVLSTKNFQLISMAISRFFENKKIRLEHESVAILAIMFFDKSCGEDVTAAIRYSGLNLTKSEYKERMISLNSEFKQLVNEAQSCETLTVGEDDNHQPDWYEVNSIDPSDGSKYIGHVFREYKDARWGTYPIHDYYGDEPFSYE